MARDIKCEIIREIGIVSTSTGGWDKLFALVSWNDRKPKYEIREWSPDRDRCGKGVTLTSDDVNKLKEILTNV